MPSIELKSNVRLGDTDGIRIDLPNGQALYVSSFDGNTTVSIYSEHNSTEATYILSPSRLHMLSTQEGQELLARA